ncbi:hypothetical protein ALI144C_35745 [Actinosynnema sp. ALI-1.44]|uniref:hypothetical protein n=1 Tax=Actinosynnema sp. ALI-1.44 TaxID=1933779 RepID=UPI00097C19DF|nr:hypothetical protein [Actinosynnema sp. ALI-1.44]ONI76057.1 hypothetical protein ALI144C_35745 [Actinosynnema sp. ALI-1.44]
MYGAVAVIGLALSATPAQAVVGGSDTQRPESWAVSPQNCIDPAGVRHSSHTDVSVDQRWIHRTMLQNLPG